MAVDLLGRIAPGGLYADAELRQVLSGHNGVRPNDPIVSPETLMEYGLRRHLGVFLGYAVQFALRRYWMNLPEKEPYARREAIGESEKTDASRGFFSPEDGAVVGEKRQNEGE